MRNRFSALPGLVIGVELILLSWGHVLWAESGEVKGDSVVNLFGEAWEKLDSYQCMIESETTFGDEKKHRRAEYAFKKPRWIRMKIVGGNNKGAQVAYNPSTRKVSACKGGVLSLIKITADPGDKLVTSKKGSRIDESHWGARVKGGSCMLRPCEQTLIGEEVFEGQETWVVERTTSKPKSNKGISAERFWIDRKRHIPVKFEERDEDGVLVYRAVYRKIRIDTGIDSTFFKL
jgi:outer membrane lipoprotein-sorting protein